MGLLKIGAALAEDNKPPETRMQIQKKAVPSKLPKLHLQTFSGEPRNWQRFWDVFERNIHNNEELEDIDKFDYLTGLLQGTAAKAIAGLEISAANYAEAIGKLKQRFGKKSAITQNHIQNLMETQPVFSEKDVHRLRNFHDHVEVNYRALRSLQVPQETFSSVVVPSLLKKLPEQIKLLITRGWDDYDQWGIEVFLEALLKEIELRETHEVGKEKSREMKQRNTRSEPTTGSALLTRGEKLDCAYCRGEHPHEKCKKVQDINERKALIRKYGRCFKCMKKNHRAKDCMSGQKCKVCQGGHHTSICEKEKGNGKDDETKSAVPSLHIRAQGKVALQTLQAYAQAPGQGPKVRCRVMLDSGSQCTFITAELAQTMKAKPAGKKFLNLATFGQNEVTKKCNVYQVKLSPLEGGEELEIEVLEVPSITTLRNVHPETMKDSYDHLKNIPFTDVSEKENLTVHLLIGADNLWLLQKGDTIRGENDQPVAIETSLGWTLSGPISQEEGATSQSASVNVTITSQPDRIEQRLNQLWDFESLGIQEEDEVQDELNEGIEFRNGRYAVNLPWKEPKSSLPDNYMLSLSRLKGQIKRMKKDEATAKQYDAVIQEQLREGIVERVEDQNEVIDGTHHLPHHPVIRESAETTKLRVVFDASSKASKNVLSLNDCLHKGPALAPMLYDVLLRMREHKIVLVGDIKKAFLQIEIKEEDRNSLRFLWVKDILAAEPEIEVFQFCRVIFGAGPSPFLLNATLRHHLDKYKEDDPDFVEKIKSSLYIDDLVSGSSTVKEAFAMFTKVKSRLQEAGFHMHKWKTNNSQLREAIKGAVDVQERSYVERDTTCAKESLGRKESESKVLGVKWDIEEDVL